MQVNISIQKRRWCLLANLLCEVVASKTGVDLRVEEDEPTRLLKLWQLGGSAGKTIAENALEELLGPEGAKGELERLKEGLQIEALAAGQVKTLPPCEIIKFKP
ncbi:hypothetical protein KKE03_03095 [Patescibacteria group bacterium]|nr:hypothetical protein [Patescibacteria group bacterium]